MKRSQPWELPRKDPDEIPPNLKIAAAFVLILGVALVVVWLVLKIVENSC